MPLLHVSTDTITPLYAHSALSEPRLVPTPLLVFALHNRYHDKDRLDSRLDSRFESSRSAVRSYMNISTCNVSVVASNCNIIKVGVPTPSSYDATRFGARARVFESCKGCVVACFGAFWFARIRFMVQVSDIKHRTIGFVLLMYPLYG